MRYNLTFLLIACLFITANTFGQNKLSGQIFDYTTRAHLRDIQIENLNTRATAISDTAGKFTIAAKPGDRIRYIGEAYLTDTVYLTNLKYTQVFLQVKTLGEVNITGRRTQLGSLALPPTPTPFGGKTVIYQTDRGGKNTGGLAVRLFNNRDRNKKNKYEAQSSEWQQQEKIAQVFSAENLKNYIPISGQEMINFIILYMPDVKTYSQVPNLALYISNCYKDFVKIPLEKRQSKEFLELNGRK